MVLTERQRQVLEMISDGHTATSIGESLGISPRTVEVYVKDLKLKFGAENVSHLIKLAFREGSLE